MATQRQTLLTFLEADSALTTLLTGGIFDASELDLEGLSPSDLPTDAVGRVQPLLLIRWRGEGEKEVIGRTERRTVELYLYDFAGYATIEAAKRRIKTLLDNQKIGSADDANMNHFKWMGGIGEFVPEEFDNVGAGEMMRFYVDYARS